MPMRVRRVFTLEEISLTLVSTLATRKIAEPKDGMEILYEHMYVCKYVMMYVCMYVCMGGIKRANI